MGAYFLVQGLHIASGIAWGGGQLLLALGVWPALLRLPPPGARRAIQAIDRPYGLTQMLFGTIVIASGLLHAVWLGEIRSWAEATGTDYGLTCLAAFALALVLAWRGSVTGRFHQHLFDGDRFHPQARRRLLVFHAVDILLLLGIITCMAMLRFGL
jgi:uncharacterized membrane protein